MSKHLKCYAENPCADFEEVTMIHGLYAGSSLNWRTQLNTVSHLSPYPFLFQRMPLGLKPSEDNHQLSTNADPKSAQ